jgi:hypothetical protein
MKKVIFFSVFLLLLLSVNTALAFTLPPRSFGGLIIAAPTPGVNCPAGRQPGSPFTIIPAGASPAGPFVGDYNPISLTYQLVPGAWILGLYNPVPLPECATTTPVPTPVPGFRTFIHGTSVPINPESI